MFTIAHQKSVLYQIKQIFIPFVASRDEQRKRGRDEDEDSETHVYIVRCVLDVELVAQKIKIGNK